MDFWLPFLGALYVGTAIGFALIAIADGEVERDEWPDILVSAALWPVVLLWHGTMAILRRRRR